MTFCRRSPATIIADDVGLGKTISAGLIISELMVRKRITRVLIACPSILCEQWKDELRTKFNLEAQVGRGKELDNLLQQNTPIVISTYHSIRDRLKNLATGDFGMLIMDEAHEIRNLYGAGNNSPKIAIEIRKVLERRVFKYLLMLTATPIQNRVWDLYSLIDCLALAKGHQNPLGTEAEFQSVYLESKPSIQLDGEKKGDFRHIVSQYMRRTRRADAKLLFPARKVEMSLVKPTETDLAVRKIVSQHISGLNGLEQCSFGVAMMSSAQAVLKQFENKSKKDPVFVEAVSELSDVINRAKDPTAKDQCLLQLVAEAKLRLGDKFRLLVFTNRLATQKQIGRLLHSKNIKFGFIEVLQRQGYFLMKTVTRSTKNLGF